MSWQAETTSWFSMKIAIQSKDFIFAFPKFIFDVSIIFPQFPVAIIEWELKRKWPIDCRVERLLKGPWVLRAISSSPLPQLHPK